MKFLCIGYLDVEAFASVPEAVQNEVMRKCMEQCVPFRATGAILEEEALEGPARVRSIQTRGGRTRVTDGPFVETKEQLGSFFIVEAPDIDEAVRIASLHPAALFGEEYGFGIEVRPIR